MRRPDSFGPMTRSPSRATATIAAAIAATTIHCSSVSNPGSHMASPPRGQRPAHQEIHASAAPRPSPRPGWRPEYRKRPFRDFNDDTSVIQYTPCPRPAWTGSERRRRRRWWPRWRRGTCGSITRRAPGDAPCVLASAAGRRPRAPAERAWIWGCEGRLDDAAATAAVLDGAYDVVALGAADAADRLAARAHELAAAVPPVAPSSDVVARSAAARRMLAQAARAARTSMAVLLTGETGSGKELLARLVHQWSPRRERTLV